MQGIDLKVMRIRAGIKQYKLAAVLDLPQSQLSDLENGKALLTEALSKRILSGLRHMSTKLQYRK